MLIHSIASTKNKFRASGIRNVNLPNIACMTKPLTFSSYECYVCYKTVVYSISSALENNLKERIRDRIRSKAACVMRFSPMHIMINGDW
jgi:hypothetical protein